jgi:hypothetical protein
LRRGFLSLPDILDGTSEVVARLAAPWMGVLVLAELPLRLLEAEFVGRLVFLGANAVRYRSSLTQLAGEATACLILATFGRAVFARACLLSLRTGRDPGREAWSVGLTPFLTQLYLNLLSRVLFLSLWITVVVPPLAMICAALAPAVAAGAERPSLFKPLRVRAESLAGLGTLLALFGVFVIAFLIALANLAFLFHAGLWLAGAAPGLDLVPWVQRLSLLSPRFWLLVWAGTCLLVQPFWLSAHVVYVHKLRARETGEDLRAWLERLRRPEAA